MDNINWALVDWSRAQFALTALYHWIFVPLTLGISFIIAIMETIYVKTGDEKWKKITKFWMKLFGINFAIGVATGIILEFEFGTNWSNYSWFVGDIFGAPLAIEGIMAFFLESTFIAIMFFGWNKVSKKAHLISSWLTAIGTNLSGIWILVANGWMQNPIGMEFNPDTMRNEMNNFWDVFFNPVSVNKFLHTITSAYTFAALFVVAVSAWLILKNKDIILAKYSMLVASVFGLIAIVSTIFFGDGSAKQVAKYQPMKLAAMEGLYHGTSGAPVVAFGIMEDIKDSTEKKIIGDLEIPNLLSILAFNNSEAYIPGIADIVHGNKEHNIRGYEERIKSGKLAIQALADYKKYKKEGNIEMAKKNLKIFKAHFKDFGYGYYLGKDPHELIPNVKISFYSFHVMVILGFLFILIFILSIWGIFKENLLTKKWILYLFIISFPLGLIAQELGWVLAEVGRQPWVIQDLLPNFVAISHIDTNSVIITFFMFLVIFTALLIAEIKIMLTAIKKGF